LQAATLLVPPPVLDSAGAPVPSSIQQTGRFLQVRRIRAGRENQFGNKTSSIWIAPDTDQSPEIP